MSNEVSHHFGAYLEIKVKKQMMIDGFVTLCENGHKASFRFCSQCGGKALPKQAVKSEQYPREIYGWVLDDERWEGVLNIVAMPKLNNLGIIIAIGGDDSDWLALNEYGEGVQVKPFPTRKEKQAMKETLKSTYADIIKALQESSNVISVEVEAGYVVRVEY